MTKKYISHVKSLFALGGPLILGQVAHMSIGITDTVMLGWYSVEALAAGVMGHTLFFLVFIIGLGFATAVMPIVASALAQEDTTQIRRITRMGLWLSIAFSAVMLPVFWWSEPLLIAIGQSKELSRATATYVTIVGFAMFPALVLNVIKSYLSAQELMAFVLVTTLAGFVINIPLNYVFIFGAFGLPELGVRGSAIASLIVQTTMAISVCIYAAKKFPEHKLFSRLWKPDPEGLMRLTKMGVPIGITGLAEAGLFSASTFMMGWLGTISVAAHGIALQITSLTFVIHVGLSSAATIQAGQAHGAQNFQKLKRSAQTALAMSFIIVILTVALFLSVPRFLVGLFLDYSSGEVEQVVALGVVLLAMAALFSAVDALQVMMLGLLRGVQDTSIPMIMAVISYWGIGCPAAYWLAFHLGWEGVGIWAGLSIGLACAAVFFAVRFTWLYKAQTRSATAAY